MVDAGRYPWRLSRCMATPGKLQWFANSYADTNEYSHANANSDQHTNADSYALYIVWWRQLAGTHYHWLLAGFHQWRCYDAFERGQ